LKDKEQTKRKLIQAVGELIKTEKFSAIKISQISKKADVDRKLIYRYFGGISGLLEAYVVENDYWMLFTEKMKALIQEGNYANSAQLITAILQNQFKYFMAEKIKSTINHIDQVTKCAIVLKHKDELPASIGGYRFIIECGFHCTLSGHFLCPGEG